LLHGGQRDRYRAGGEPGSMRTLDCKGHHRDR
jgi:hypothetical protein